MQLTIVLLAALCLAVPVLSQNSPCNPKVSAPKHFNITELTKYQYRYVLATDNPDTRQYSSAEVITTQVGNLYYSTFVTNYQNGSQASVTYSYGLDDVFGSTVNEIVAVNGQQTNEKISVIYYAQKPLVYAQFLVCGPSQYGTDLRFAILYGDTKLDAKLKKELVKNDRYYGFKGVLIEIGKSTELLLGLRLHDYDN